MVLTASTRVFPWRATSSSPPTQYGATLTMNAISITVAVNAPKNAAIQPSVDRCSLSQIFAFAPRRAQVAALNCFRVLRARNRANVFTEDIVTQGRVIWCSNELAYGAISGVVVRRDQGTVRHPSHGRGPLRPWRHASRWANCPRVVGSFSPIWAAIVVMRSSRISRRTSKPSQVVTSKP